jgi:metal-responsive CopG/Arc/MetJ family transcriptional regulator
VRVLEKRKDKSEKKIRALEKLSTTKKPKVKKYKSLIFKWAQKYKHSLISSLGFHFQNEACYTWILLGLDVKLLGPRYLF